MWLLGSAIPPLERHLRVVAHRAPIVPSPVVARLGVACSPLSCEPRETPVEHIQVTATFPNIGPDNLAEFKTMAADVLKPTAEDPGVLQYDWFFNADEITCVVRETYQNSQAVLTHLGMVGEMLGPLVELGGGIELQIFGSPSEQLVQAVEAFHPTYYSYFQGK